MAAGSTAGLFRVCARASSRQETRRRSAPRPRWPLSQVWPSFCWSDVVPTPVRRRRWREAMRRRSSRGTARASARRSRRSYAKSSVSSSQASNRLAKLSQSSSSVSVQFRLSRATRPFVRDSRRPTVAEVGSVQNDPFDCFLSRTLAATLSQMTTRLRLAVIPIAQLTRELKPAYHASPQSTEEVPCAGSRSLAWLSSLLRSLR